MLFVCVFMSPLDGVRGKKDTSAMVPLGWSKSKSLQVFDVYGLEGLDMGRQTPA